MTPDQDKPTEATSTPAGSQQAAPVWATPAEVSGSIVPADQTTIVVSEEESTGVETANLHPLPVIQPLSDTTPKQ